MVNATSALRCDMVYRQVAIMERILTPIAFALLPTKQLGFVRLVSRQTPSYLMSSSVQMSLNSAPSAGEPIGAFHCLPDLNGGSK